MKWALLVVALSGCQFDSGGLTVGDPNGTGIQPEPQTSDGSVIAPPAPDAAPIAPPTVDAGEPRKKGLFERCGSDGECASDVCEKIKGEDRCTLKCGDEEPSCPAPARCNRDNFCEPP